MGIELLDQLADIVTRGYVLDGLALVKSAQLLLSINCCCLYDGSLDICDEPGRLLYWDTCVCVFTTSVTAATWAPTD